MIKVDISGLEGRHALSKAFHHYGVWKIFQVRIDGGYNGLKVIARGENTPWLDLSKCYIGDKEELDITLEMIERQDIINSLSFTHNIPPC